MEFLVEKLNKEIELKIIRIEQQSDWKDVTLREVVDMLHQIVNKHGRVCIAIKNGDAVQKIVNLNRMWYFYTDFKIHFASKKIFKILSENKNVDGS